MTCGNGTVPVAGTVIYADDTAVFWPTAHLSANNTFTVTLTTGVASAAGIPLRESGEGQLVVHGGEHSSARDHRVRPDRACVKRLFNLEAGDWPCLRGRLRRVDALEPDHRGLRHAVRLHSPATSSGR